MNQSKDGANAAIIGDAEPNEESLAQRRAAVDRWRGLKAAQANTMRRDFGARWDHQRRDVRPRPRMAAAE
jgi:hypothetical protein